MQGPSKRWQKKPQNLSTVDDPRNGTETVNGCGPAAEDAANHITHLSESAVITKLLFPPRPTEQEIKKELCQHWRVLMAMASLSMSAESI
jgi:hypothetical protein